MYMAQLLQQTQSEENYWKTDIFKGIRARGDAADTVSPLVGKYILLQKGEIF